MTMPLLHPPFAIEAADLRDAGEVAAIDRYVRGHPDATPFHLPAWILAVAAGCGQRAHCLVARGAGGALVGVLPLTEIRSLLFGRAMVASGFAVGGGALGDSASIAFALIEAGWALARRRGCPSFELRGGPLPEGAPWHHDSQTYVGFVRPLAGDDEAELAAIPRKHRAEVRKGLAADLAVSVGQHAAAQRDHYGVYAASVHNLGTPVFPLRLFRMVLKAFPEESDILTISAGGKAVASVLSLYFNGTVLPFWGGGLAEARALRANERLYFELMRHARARGATRFDFGRSKLGTGPAAYKKNWGFEPQPLRYAKRAAEGQAPRDVNPLSPRYQAKIAAWKKLPLPVATAIGPLIARGLG